MCYVSYKSAERCLFAAYRVGKKFNKKREKRKKKMEKKEIFADGIGQIHFAGGMVRYDFVTLQPTEDGKAPEAKSTVRVIMPPQGFLNAFNSMQQLIDKLLEAGILQKNEAAAKKTK